MRPSSILRRKDDGTYALRPRDGADMRAAFGHSTMTVSSETFRTLATEALTAFERPRLPLKKLVMVD